MRPDRTPLLRENVRPDGGVIRPTVQKDRHENQGHHKHERQAANHEVPECHPAPRTQHRLSNPDLISSRLLSFLLIVARITPIVWDGMHACHLYELTSCYGPNFP